MTFLYKTTSVIFKDFSDRTLTIVIVIVRITFEFIEITRVIACNQVFIEFFCTLKQRVNSLSEKALKIAKKMAHLIDIRPLSVRFRFGSVVQLQKGAGNRPDGYVLKLRKFSNLSNYISACIRELLTGLTIKYYFLAWNKR